MKRRPTSLPGSGVVRRERVYRIVLGGPPPADLAARCSGVWRELLDIAERLRQHAQGHTELVNGECPATVNGRRAEVLRRADMARLSLGASRAKRKKAAARSRPDGINNDPGNGTAEAVEEAVDAGDDSTS